MVIGVVGVQLSGVNFSQGSDGSNNGGGGQGESNGGIDYGSGNRDSDGGEYNDVGIDESGKSNSGVGVVNDGCIFGGRTIIILDSGDRDGRGGIKMVKVLLVKMILMMFCVGSDDIGIGVSVSDGIVFDGVDIRLFQLELIDGSGGGVGVRVSGEFDSSFVVGSMIVVMMMVVIVIVVGIGRVVVEIRMMVRMVVILLRVVLVSVVIFGFYELFIVFFFGVDSVLDMGKRFIMFFQGFVFYLLQFW